MKKLISSIFLLLILGQIACRHHSHVRPLLQEAEALMSDHPDSSLSLLESVRFPEKLLVENKYAHEKLQKENLQLKLKKCYWGGSGIIGLVAVFSLVVLVIIKRFNLQVKNKIQLISKLNAQVEDLQQKLKINSDKQTENLSEIAILSGQLVENSACIRQMEEIRFQLIRENKRLEKKSLDFEQTIHLLRENIVKLNMDKIPDLPQEASFALLTKIKKELSPLQDDEWAELFLIANLQHKKIMDRLSASFPQLKPEDLKLCCLTKLMFTNEEISSIFDIQVDALAKRKRRLSIKFGKEKWDKGGFNAYIEEF